MEDKPKVEVVAAALYEHFREVFLPSGTAKKIIERVHKGGSEKAVINDVEMMLLEFAVLALKKKDSTKEVFDKFKTQ